MWEQTQNLDATWEGLDSYLVQICKANQKVSLIPCYIVPFLLNESWDFTIISCNLAINMLCFMNKSWKIKKIHHNLAFFKKSNKAIREMKPNSTLINYNNTY